MEEISLEKKGLQESGAWYKIVKGFTKLYTLHKNA